MNVLEHYITEVHSVKVMNPPDFDRESKWVEVDLTFDCYGVVKREKRIMREDEWIVIKQNGYFMA